MVSSEMPRGKVGTFDSQKVIKMYLRRHMTSLFDY